METKGLMQDTDDWEVLKRFLPVGWEGMAKQSGALRRLRGFANAETLLRVLLIHLAEGCSARETVVRARLGGLAEVSDVALLKRLKGAGEWLRWMAEAVMRSWTVVKPAEVFGEGTVVRVVDATVVHEPGATGSTWRFHYAVRLPSLQCDEVHLTSSRVGESFKRFHVQPGDVVIADRGYAHPAGIGWVIEAGADVLVRINLTNVPLRNRTGAAFPLLEALRQLKAGQAGERDVWLDLPQGLVPARLCAAKLSRAAADRAGKRALRENNRKGHRMRPETLEAAGYVMVVTTLPRNRLRTTNVLELYRGRWQVELAFKRLKSLLDLGHLKKTDPDAARSWLHGKLLVAFLIEALISAGQLFFPWGYPLDAHPSSQPLPLAGNLIHDPSHPTDH